MEPFFTFLGSYWWLAFPLFGVLASVGGAWERSARRRHKRRLEVLHAKAELKAAQAAARGKGAPAAALPPMTGPTATTPGAAEAGAAGRAGAASESSASDSTEASTETGGTHAEQLERLFALHDAVTARWLDYELDVAKMIAFPAMSDGRQPLTAAFLRAKRIADGVRPASAKAKVTRDQVTEYRNAVADYEVSFDVAEREARRIRDSSFSEVERKRLSTAKQLLTVAIDQAATPAERQVAYRRVREELDGLLLLSDDAIEVLEKKVMLELPADAKGGADAATAAPTKPAPAKPAAAPSSPAAEPPSAKPKPQPAPWPVPKRSNGDGPDRSSPSQRRR
ncbi:hypothetical protein [Microbacterium sp. C7(2022)]|uniref:hypothetical protein n=1 Tax=Microbacterium sp. C7(2022) TaxID=2992759 RepID=UPI00237BEAF7|nr:hypothetical protein [Microbacterium sp. C7(2022)]MDE0545063.1 hypothetical protein [Microbacterium sp. C7(2022)]